jgi:DNA-directed RNA polymerase specialized sigma24 family protein
LGCSVGNVKSLTSRGIARLRQLLEDDMPVEDLHG